jgi:hypothetical protein
LIVVFYISGHGFGHASRVIEVINAVTARRDDLDIVVRTTAPRWLFEKTLKARLKPGSTTATPGIEYISTETDTGIVQIDSLHLDANASVARARAFMSTFDARVANEGTFLRNRHARLVVADLPPLGIAAAAQAGIPAVALGNFTWDWVYSAYPGTDELVGAIAEAYRTAPLALRLPMHGGFEAFETIVDLPFVARRSARDPDETRHALGLPPGERLVLVSFGGYGVDGLSHDALSRLDGYVAVVTGNFQGSEVPPFRGSEGEPRDIETQEPRNVCFVDESQMYAAGYRYEDLVRAVDVVATKPGYGIISECLANDTAILYTSRGDFIEYGVLVEAMPRFLRSAFIGHADLFAGDWTPHLDALLAQAEPPARPATDGAEVAAARLLAMI